MLQEAALCRVGGVSMQEPHGSRDGDAVQPAAVPPGSRWGNLFLLLVSLLTTFLVIEIGYPLPAGLPLFKLANWRTDHVVLAILSERANPDPVLGWVNKSFNVHEDGYTTSSMACARTSARRRSGAARSLRSATRSPRA